ncbi:NAD(P)/FAD-dependent oxidoreductase [Mycobacterium sp. NPDC003449]
MTDISRIVLIGGGVAAAGAAEELRRQNYAGAITLLSRELDAPYHRPPITKALLSDPDHAIAIADPNWWSDNDIELLTRSAVAALDLSGHRVTLANKRTLDYDRALIATGAMVRRLTVDGAALPGIHYLRTPANAHKLRQDAAAAERIVLVGGSFIAVEVAAAMSAQGHRCTLVMQETLCLERTFGRTVGMFVDGLLRRHGVEILGGTDVAAFTGTDSLAGVRTTDDVEIACDLAVVGVGAVPDAKLAAKSGLRIGESGGVRCDSQLRTSHPDVYAAGDVCEYHSVLHGRQLRVEHERHAAAQGITAARNMLGARADHREVPYFWTDIADWARLEYVGAARYWNTEIVTGSVESGVFTVWYLRDDRLVGALTSGRPADLDLARTIISADPGERPCARTLIADAV